MGGELKRQRLLSIVGLGLLVLLSSPAMAQGTGSPEARLKALGIHLPPAPKPLASYVPAVRTGNLVFLAGQGPLADGKPTVTGKVGAELSEEEGNKAARATMLTLLAVLRQEIGSLDRVRRVVKLVGWVNSAPGFTRQPWVINGASDLLIEIFGEAGKHARSSLGANELPLNIPVEIELVVEVLPDSGRR
jgi:enamine deaminase RidA (YjgF/YER057c/UK114 family)